MSEREEQVRALAQRVRDAAEKACKWTMECNDLQIRTINSVIREFTPLCEALLAPAQSANLPPTPTAETTATVGDPTPGAEAGKESALLDSPADGFLAAWLEGTAKQLRAGATQPALPIPFYQLEGWSKKDPLGKDVRPPAEGLREALEELLAASCTNGERCHIPSHAKARMALAARVPVAHREGHRWTHGIKGKDCCSCHWNADSSINEDCYEQWQAHVASLDAPTAQVEYRDGTVEVVTIGADMAAVPPEPSATSTETLAAPTLSLDAPTPQAALLSPRQWLISGGNGHEDGEDGLRALRISGESLVEYLEEYKEYLLAAAPPAGEGSQQ